MYFYPARGAFVLFWVMSGHAVCTLLHLISHFLFLLLLFFYESACCWRQSGQETAGEFFFTPDHAGWPTLMFVCFFSYPCCPRHCSRERCGWFNHWHLCLLKLCSISAVRGGAAGVSGDDLKLNWNQCMKRSDQNYQLAYWNVLCWVDLTELWFNNLLRLVNCHLPSDEKCPTCS